MFESKPKEAKVPSKKKDHPELDTTPELDDEGRTKYMSLIGALQWLISLGRFDIMHAVVSLSRFRAAPREGHLERVKQIYGYLKKNKTAAVCYRTGLPDYGMLKQQNYDWMYQVYGKVREEISSDAPEPLGNVVRNSTWVDANLMHDLITG